MQKRLLLREGLELLTLSAAACALLFFPETASAAVVRGLGHSRRLFEMRFREVMGHSVLEEIQRVRMEKVFFLLKETDKPIGTLAAFCGYRSDIALRKAFRTRTGLSMAEWRRRNGRK